MYVKVHKKNDQWFRVDNGALVGDAVSPGGILEALKSLYGAEKQFANNNNFVIIYFGYFDNQNHFNHFCQKKACSDCQPVLKKRFCYKRANWIKSAGYYIKI